MYSRALRQFIFLTQCSFLSQGAVAVVASLSGEAGAVSPGSQTSTAIHTFDWLDAGVRIEVRAKSTMRLILRNGRAYELGAGANATVDKDALSISNPPVRELNRLPPMPQIAALPTNAPDTSGAAPIRGGTILKGLYPDHAPAIASHVTLSFAPVPDALNYSVIVEDEMGNILLRVTTPLTKVDVPADALGPGSLYAWRVRAFAASGVVGEGSAEFVTISKDELDRRAAFAQAINAEGDAMGLALIAGVDREIGLLADACDEFEAALLLRPSDPGLDHALATARAALTAARGR
jgi:hypothetical protein